MTLNWGAETGMVNGGDTLYEEEKKGLVRDLNPGPLAP